MPSSISMYMPFMSFHYIVTVCELDEYQGKWIRIGTDKLRETQANACKRNNIVNAMLGKQLSPILYLKRCVTGGGGGEGGGGLV